MDESEVKTDTKENNPDENPILRNARGYFLPGTRPGPGRPPGKSGYKTIKDAIKQQLQDNPGEFEEFIRHFITKNRELAWQMLEGKPQQDITSKGERLPTPLLANVSDNNSDTKDSEAKQED